MTDIDWSKAPEGYPVWIEDLAPDTGFDGSGWHRDDGDRYTGEDGEYWTKPEEGIYRVHSQAPQWGGTGLPPVGVVCELRTKVGGWGEAEIKYHGPAICVWLWVRRDGNTAQIEFAENPERLEFRPIRTPEQIAAEEREAAIDEMAGWAGVTGLPIDRERKILGRLYDGGYRKQGETRMDNPNRTQRDR